MCKQHHKHLQYHYHPMSINGFTASTLPLPQSRHTSTSQCCFRKASFSCLPNLVILRPMLPLLSVLRAYASKTCSYLVTGLPRLRSPPYVIQCSVRLIIHLSLFFSICSLSISIYASFATPPNQTLHPCLSAPQWPAPVSPTTQSKVPQPLLHCRPEILPRLQCRRF